MIVEAHALKLKTKYYVIFQYSCSIMTAFDMIGSKARLFFFTGLYSQANQFIAWQLTQSI